MLLPEQDHEVFKRWLLPRIDAISIAEGAVLSDYIVELVASHDAEATIKANCLESLSEFLQDSTAPFVDEVFKALKNRSYVRPVKKSPAATTAPIPSIVSDSNSQYENTAPFSAPTEPAAIRAAPAQHRLPGKPPRPSSSTDVLHNGAQSTRKRKTMEQETTRLSRSKKQTAMREDLPRTTSMPFFQNMLSTLPPPPPGPLPFNPNDPASFATFMAAMGFQLPGVAPLSFPISQGTDLIRQEPKARCEDFYTRGVCALGSFCSFDHGDAVAEPPQRVPEYDPEQSFLALQAHGNPGKPRKRRISRSQTHDRSSTTLVVEQIPPEQCNPEDVHDFFSQFGDISNMQMDQLNQTAIITFRDRKAATRAYRSPKAVFDNRFVKVFWQKSGQPPVPVEDIYSDLEMTEEEEKLDLEEIKKRQEEAQKAFEERRRKIQEADARAEEIEKQLKVKDEEINQIRQQLIALGDDLDTFERHQSVGYSESLAVLQAEADNLFDQRDYYRAAGSHGHGGFRGPQYPAYISHGRGGFRGAYRGRGAYGSILPLARSSVKRLDYRPRRLAVMDIRASSSRDEALRQYLLNVPNCTSIVEHPEQEDAVILTFKERYQAEIFIDNSFDIPNIGKLDLAWVPNDAFGGIEPSTTTAKENDEEDSDDASSTTVGEHDKPLASIEAQVGKTDVDLDVADDEDQWR